VICKYINGFYLYIPCHNVYSILAQLGLHFHLNNSCPKKNKNKKKVSFCLCAAHFFFGFQIVHFEIVYCKVDTEYVTLLATWMTQMGKFQPNAFCCGSCVVVRVFTLYCILAIDNLIYKKTDILFFFTIVSKYKRK